MNSRRPSPLKPLMNLNVLVLRLLVGLTGCCLGTILAAETSQTPKEEKAKPATPTPGGPQEDGPFRKVVLEADRQNSDGDWEDSVRDPMEIAVAWDGRVFYAQRYGVIKMWKPDTKSSVTIATIKVFDGLEDGMLGI